MKMKIGIAGTHSTGKTTLLSYVRRRLRAAGYSVARVSELATEARRRGFPILRDHTFESTLWIISRGIARELEAAINADIVLVDRPVPDAFGYLLAALESRQESLHEDEAKILQAIVRLYGARYTRLFKTQIDPSQGIGDNKVRDLDFHFRDLADRGIDRVFMEIGVPYTILPTEPMIARQIVLDSINSLLTVGSARIEEYGSGVGRARFLT